MSRFDFSAVGDPGNYRTDGTRFYYQPGVAWKSPNINENIQASGPGQTAVGKLVQGYSNSDLLSLGDLTYSTGASTLIDAANGLDYNNFMAPYPSPKFTTSPYQQNPGDVVWPYDLYDYPKGFPNPVTGGAGGSSDGINRFWPTIGNHDYGLRIAFSETNISQYTYNGEPNEDPPAAPTSTAVPQPFIDYFGWLADPSLLTKQKNIKIASADGTGQSGIYYSVTLGEQENKQPLIEVFSIDAQRLMMNTGGSELRDGFGNATTQSALINNYYNPYSYDPTIPYSINNPNSVASLTSDPANGQKQYDWLYSGIKNSTAKWKIIMGHQPIYSSGQWGGTNPDDHMSNPALQKLLHSLTTIQKNGQPAVNFDAYLNGHSHYYQRVLEGNQLGIGQGIPFITMGNSGRTLYAINQTNYGDNVYNPSTPGLTQSTYNGETSQPEDIDITPYLLPSSPTTVGVSGGYFTTTGQNSNGQAVPYYQGEITGFTAGAYGFGFGAQDNQADDSYLFFNYKQTDVPDPAITENLLASSRNKALIGWDGLTAQDWKPALATGISSNDALLATAQFKITIGTDGTISAISVANGGKGYMASKAGNHIVDFEIRGNDSFTNGQTVNPNNYAIATLTFTAGVLSNAALKSSGQGYTFLGQANAASNATLTTPQFDTIPINTSLLESWYTQPFNNYQDWYLITDSVASNSTDVGSYGSLSISLLPKSQTARDLISTTPLTTGYNATKQQQKYDRAQSGELTIVDPLTGQIIGAGTLSNGTANLKLNALASSDRININFLGDPTSSYQINFKSSSTASTTNFIYRSFDPITGSHFYTASLGENALAISQAGYRYEEVGILNRGDSPIYKLYNPITTDHFYTINQNEKNSLLLNPSGYNFQGIAFSGYQSQGSGLTSVQRLYNPTNGLHFYTTNSLEAANAISGDGYLSEGVGWYF